MTKKTRGVLTKKMDQTGQSNLRTQTIVDVEIKRNLKHLKRIWRK